MEEIHEPGGGVPAMMAPLVLITTVVAICLAAPQGGKEQPFKLAVAWQTSWQWLKLSQRRCTYHPHDRYCSGLGAVRVGQFTTISLGIGFRGGEVTPLFFIGAALGLG